jgi:hypothetical protein
MKKKGLIISTIVMVVVLVASLTTATYAWFSANAEVTVDSLNVRTTAADGLQIAMTNSTVDVSRVSGSLEYGNSGWTGDVTDWGSNLDFSSIKIGEMSDAITRVVSGTTLASMATTYGAPVDGYTINGYDSSEAPYGVAEDATHIAVAQTIGTDEGKVKFNYGKHYTKGASSASNAVFTVADSADADDVVYLIVSIADATAAQKDAVGTTNYYCAKHESTWASVIPAAYVTESALNQDIYLIPTGYDASVQPTGYEVATANSKFYKLTMAVMNMKAVTEIGLGMNLTVGGTGSVGTITAENPGMASAARMLVHVDKATDASAHTTGTTQGYAPYGDYKLNKAAGSMNNTDAQDASDQNAVFTKHVGGDFAFLIDHVAADGIASGSVYYVTIYIWIEGTDKECDNLTAGTTIDFSMQFIYAAGANISDKENVWYKGVASTGDVTPIEDVAVNSRS